MLIDRVLDIICSLLSPAVRDVHSLVIRSVRHAHGGVYKSVISNKVGKATCYAHLYVTGDCHLLFSHFMLIATFFCNKIDQRLLLRREVVVVD